MLNPTERFSSRVEHYQKYRPGYPRSILDLLKTKCHLMSSSVVADMGSGTGLLSELFLKNGNPVFGVEPNDEMRKAGETFLKRYPTFTSIGATAERTTLPANSIHFVVSGQAFHWFKRHLVKKEFSRILAHNGWVVLIWNERLTNTSAFLADYEQLLLTYATDYHAVDHRKVNHNVLQAFFHPNGYEEAIFRNVQPFDFAGLKGRLLSSSYIPEKGHPNFEPMMTKLYTLYERHQQNQAVEFAYQTKVYFGRLAKQP